MIGLEFASLNQATAVVIRLLQRRLLTSKTKHLRGQGMSFHAEIKPIETSPPKTDFHQSGPQHNIQTGVSNESKKGISSGQRMLGQHDINLCIKEDSTPYAATVVHPGLQPEFRDSYGNPSLWGLFRLASTCRMYAMHTPVDSSGRCFLEYDKLTDEHFTFFASSQASIARCLYEPDFPNHPLEVHVTGGHIGRTSISTVATITSPRDQEQRNIFSQTNQVVLIDKASRRPVAVSEYWREHYGPHCIRGVPLIIQQKEPPVGGVSAVYQVKVAWSDTDLYQHTNFASYIRFAVDAVQEGLRQGAFGGHLTQEDVRAGTAEVSVSYIGESVQGDVLHVHMWCPPGTNRTVVCSMEKEGQVINQVTLTYHAAAV